MAVLVAAPARKPRLGGIKSIVGEFTVVERLSVTQGGITWDALGCAFPSATRAGCYDAVVPDAPKTPVGIATPAGAVDAFALYNGIECTLGGDTGTEGSFESQAEALLLQGEDRKIEAKLWGWLNAVASTNAPDLVQALAAAESDADANYLGQPVITVSRYDSQRLFAAGALVREGGVLVTANGSPVLATSAVTNGKVSATGALEVYATSIISAQAPRLNQNKDLAIAERVYAIGVDCAYRKTFTVTP